MVTYDYRCRACGRDFDVRRAMADDAGDVRCPDGHDDVARIWSAAVMTGRRSAPASVATGAAAGGCCGGGCCS